MENQKAILLMKKETDFSPEPTGQIMRLPDPKPSIWHRLGFHTCIAMLEGGNLFTRVTARLSWKDRLRVLVSGRVMVAITIITEPECETKGSASRLSVLPPNYEG